MSRVDEIAALREALEDARPLLVGLSVRERLLIARQIETGQRTRFHVEPLSPVPSTTED